MQRPAIDARNARVLWAAEEDRRQLLVRSQTTRSSSGYWRYPARARNLCQGGPELVANSLATTKQKRGAVSLVSPQLRAVDTKRSSKQLEAAGW